MRGLGTIVNVVGVVVGGLLGLLIKGGLSEKMRDNMQKAGGLAVIFIGASGALEKMIHAGGSSMLLIVSLVLGGLLGTAVGIQNKIEGIGDRLQNVFKNSGSRFSDGFVTATLVTTVGSMAIVGSLQDGISGDSTVLLVKSILDFFTVMILAAGTGVGAVFSAIPMGIYQGLITAGAYVLSPLINDSLMSNFTMVGSVLVCAIGINLSCGEKFKVGDLLPALLGPVVYEVALTVMRSLQII